MPETIEQPATGAVPARTGRDTGADDVAVEPSPPARRLARMMAAVRVSFTWFGVRKTLTPQQRSEAAEGFGAEGNYLSATKKLLDTRHPDYRAVTAIRGRALHYWRGVSLPYPEPGLRLIRQDRVKDFDERLTELRRGLEDAVARLDGRYEDLKSAARVRLGRLYNAADYPPSLAGLFDVQWEFPSIEPPNYLLQLNPALYEQEKARVAARFEEAVKLAEEAFTSEFAKLVSHLVERLRSDTGGGDVGGDKKVFRDSAVTNLQEFFQRFKSLNVRSSDELDKLVETARGAIAGVRPQELRDSDDLRRQVGTQLTAVRSALDGMLVDRPRRRILRARPAEGG